MALIQPILASNALYTYRGLKSTCPSLSSAEITDIPRFILVRFIVKLTQFHITWKEEISTKELHDQNCLLVCLLETVFIANHRRKAQPTVGNTIPMEVA